MIRNLWQLSLIVTTCSACVFGFSNQNTVSKRSQTAWFEERLNHNGLGLTDLNLKAVADLGNEKHFNETLEKILIPRAAGSPENELVRNFIIQQMENLAWTVETHSFEDKTPQGRISFTNVIATLNPSATRRLVLACHFDSRITPVGFLGACDSAVPCAMMINLAFTMQEPLNNLLRESSDLTLQFIFFDGEEAFETWSGTDSLYGARRLASKLYSTPFPPGGLGGATTELNRIDLFVLLDLIGTADCGFYSYFENSEGWYARLSSFEKRFMNLKLINQRTPMFREQSYYGAGIEDDHLPFLKKGVPVLHLISAPFPSVWHEITDNLDALDPKSIENMNTLMRAFVMDYLHLSL